MVAQDRTNRLLNILMNKSVLDPRARAELEEILGPDGQISSISELICCFIDDVPYISPDQTDALKTDIRTIFDGLDAEGGQPLSKKIEAGKEEIKRGKFTFSLPDMPSDVQKFKQKALENLIKQVIGDLFGKLIDNLSSNDQLRKRVQIDSVIKRAVEEFLK